MMTGISLNSRSIRKVSKPSSSGIMTSSRTISGSCVRMASRASSPLCASMTRCSSSSRFMRMKPIMRGSSSTTRMRFPLTRLILRLAWYHCWLRIRKDRSQRFEIATKTILWRRKVYSESPGTLRMMTGHIVAAATVIRKLDQRVAGLLRRSCLQRYIFQALVIDQVPKPIAAD